MDDQEKFRILKKSSRNHLRDRGRPKDSENRALGMPGPRLHSFRNFTGGSPWSVARSLSRTASKITFAAILTGGIISCGPGDSLAVRVGCAHCHFREKESIGPSLKTIGAVYPVREELDGFLRGKISQRIDPSRALAMEAFRIRYRSLADGERAQILDWIYDQ